MKLSEVIKAIEDGSESKFWNSKGYSILKSVEYNGIFVGNKYKEKISIIPFHGWKENKISKADGKIIYEPYAGSVVK